MKVSDLLDGLDPEKIGQDFEKGLAEVRKNLAIMPEDKQREYTPFIKKLNEMNREMKANGFETPTLDKLSKGLMSEVKEKMPNK